MADAPRLPPRSGSKRSATYRWLDLFAVLLMGGMIGASIVRITWPSVLRPAAAIVPGGAAPDPARKVEMPMLTRSGDQLTVPVDSPLRTRLAILPVTITDVQEARRLPASVEADPARVVTILPPLGGRVTALKVKLGDTVTKGQPLVVIESGDLAQAYADADKAHAQLALTRRALDRARGLTQVGGGAVKDMESATNDLAQAQAESNRADARLKTIAGAATITGSRLLTVPSPVAGVVTALSVAPGGYINDATQSMMTVTNLDEVWVTANVPEVDIGFIFPGQGADVSFLAYPGKVFHSTVLFVGALMEPDTRRTKVRLALLDHDGALKPNMFATVTFQSAPRPTLLVPNAALLMNNDATSVFVETAPWTFQRRTVVTGFETAGQTAVISGLAAGERVVVRGGVLLND